MSRFYASIQGNRGEATRMGSPSSGITAHPRGWNLGVRVFGYPEDGNTDADAFTVTLTGGSNGARRTLTLAEISEEGNGIVRVSVPVQDGGRSVFYVDRDGRIMSRPSVLT